MYIYLMPYGRYLVIPPWIVIPMAQGQFLSSFRIVVIDIYHSFSISFIRFSVVIVIGPYWKLILNLGYIKSYLTLISPVAEIIHCMITLLKFNKNMRKKRLTSLDMAWTNVHPDFQNSSKITSFLLLCSENFFFIIK